MIDQLNPIKFPWNSFVRHIETGRVYHIVDTPATCKVHIANNWFPGYAYRDTDAIIMLYTREQEDMEKHFELYTIPNKDMRA